ncbi:MAG: phosphatidate cytidylyltransferase [Bacilli bacterium]|jgi:phosphatidate cytidylyltransferase|nr:phosphatidate cytidylyltransferase [Bacilli bacterium]MDD3121309.1 phosphatidate cytidylyltransferase [Bacilli bacterium]MDD4063440.1 phosphatidate cytidylyltransferase [Bacilli bacterium]MDD4482101.1 phosphatidate cytidylyltransferase [Bacilli bacterium]MDD5183168.1 phosphatidate cytidylyltransferase [Bacilli bacterium]
MTPKIKNFLIRAVTGVILLAIIIPLLIIEGPWFMILGIIGSIIATFEMINMFALKAESLKVLKYIIPFFSGVIVYLAVIAAKNNNYFWLFLSLIIAVIISMIIIIFIKNSKSYDFSNIVMSLLYCGVFFGFVIALKYIPDSIININNSNVIINIKGPWSFAYIYTIVLFTDMSAYMFGTKFGKHKLCPTISPKKSIEGAISGLVFGSLFGAVALFLFGIINLKTAMNNEILVSIIIAISLSLVLSFVVQIGDLVASKFKRTYEIKDFSNILPGHGGIIDRFDSLILSGALFYIIIQVIMIL